MQRGGYRTLAALVAALSLPAASDAPVSSRSRPRSRARSYPRDPVGRRRHRRGSPRLGVARVRPRVRQAASRSAGTCSCTDRTSAAGSSTGKPRSSGAARRQRSPAACCVSSSAAFTDSALDPLGPANTPFSLVRAGTSPQSAGAPGDGVPRRRVGRRLRAGGPAPAAASRERRPLRLRRADHATSSSAAPSATSRWRVRVSGTQPRLDWSAHVFGGRSRRPTFVPRCSLRRDARQPWMRSTPRSFRPAATSRRRAPTGGFCGGGFRPPRRRRRHRARTDVRGPSAAAPNTSASARLAAATTSSRASSSWPTRGATAPTSRSPPRCAPGLRVAQHGRFAPRRSTSAISFDWAFRGHGRDPASVEKALAESPTVNLRPPARRSFHRESHAEHRSISGRMTSSCSVSSALNYRDDPMRPRLILRGAAAWLPFVDHRPRPRAHATALVVHLFGGVAVVNNAIDIWFDRSDPAVADARASNGGCSARTPGCSPRSGCGLTARRSGQQCRAP